MIISKERKVALIDIYTKRVVNKALKLANTEEEFKHYLDFYLNKFRQEAINQKISEDTISGGIDGVINSSGRKCYS